jgi:hypothetical protein
LLLVLSVEAPPGARKSHKKKYFALVDPKETPKLWPFQYLVIKKPRLDLEIDSVKGLNLDQQRGFFN